MVDNTQTAGSNTNNRAAVGFMLITVCFWSLTPFFVGISGAEHSPFLFASITRIAEAISCIILLLVWKKNFFSYQIFTQIITGIKGIKITHHLAIATFSCVDIIIFSFALRFVDISTATLFYESWPIVFIFWLSILFRSEGKYTPQNTSLYILSFVAFLGFMFVLMGESTNQFSEFQISLKITIGVLFAFIAGAIGAIGTSHSIRYCDSIRKLIGQIKSDPGDLYCVLLYLAMSRPIAGIIAGTGAYMTNEDISADILIYAGIFGAFILLVPTILFRLANLATCNLGINALSYSTPLVALAWLALADMIQLPQPDFLIIGTIAIIVANLLLNFEASIRLAYKALIIALWVCGTVVYLHDGFLLPDYASTVGISATLFILILSFRTDRLVRRTTAEESMFLSLFRKISSLAKKDEIAKDEIAKDAANALLAIDAHKTPDELRNAYIKLKGFLLDCSTDNSDLLDDLEAEIDVFAHSKQQGVNFGELTALGFIGIILIFALLFFQPSELLGWSGFFTEMSAFILAAVVLFLFCNIIDLQRDRSRPILEKDQTKGGIFSIVFRDATNRGFEQWISMIVCTAIVLAYGWLFWNQWLL